MAQKRGLSYPLQITNGGLSVSEDLALVEEHIAAVLDTQPFERVMRSDYGFDPSIFETLEPNAINARISAAIEDQVPEVTDLEVSGGVDTADRGIYNVSLKYKVNGISVPPLSLALNM